MAIYSTTKKKKKKRHREKPECFLLFSPSPDLLALINWDKANSVFPLALDQSCTRKSGSSYIKRALYTKYCVSFTNLRLPVLGL
jgi:hypothetical protein